MTNLNSIMPSDNTALAEWIRERLSPPDMHVVTSVVPSGFEAYARIFHPVQVPQEGIPLIRWAEVSNWSGVAMHRRVQWHEIALPQSIPSTDPPWTSQGPRQGSLCFPDALALIEDLAPFTSTPQSCCFCVWVGFGDGGSDVYTDSKSVQPKRSAPPGPRKLVELPWRDYELFEGPLSRVLDTTALHHQNQQTPNLWWPKDHAWCVASEIDLPWTYVGGPAELIARLASDERIEVVGANPADVISIEVQGWLSDLIEQTAIEVLSNGSALVALATGTVTILWEPRGHWVPRGRRQRGVLKTRSGRSSGWSGSNGPIRARDSDDLRRQVAARIQHAILALAEV